MPEVAEPLLPMVELLRRAYPDGIPEPEYAPVLVVLGEHMSERNIGQLLWAYSGTEPVVAQNDLAGALSTSRPTPQAVAGARARLMAADPEELLRD
jgi:Protein of unknown function (DUF3349)